MKKIIAILTSVLFILSFVGVDVLAQDDRVQHLKAEIERHKAALKDLRAQLHSLVGPPQSGEGGGEGEGRRPPKGEGRPPKGMGSPHRKGPHKGREGMHKGPHKGRGQHPGKEGRGPGLKQAPGKGPAEGKGRGPAGLKAAPGKGKGAGPRAAGGGKPGGGGHKGGGKR